ncbi:MAG TPA: right-handed parallel beta-helix repeat-containing protein [Tepidisphaeraceae bacterium]|jgi:parallel beta-helix repeat protein|nr:right-handed parallel beta-helix repeat-containing protein [Tepidisphaeraceae bacterium]
MRLPVGCVLLAVGFASCAPIHSAPPSNPNDLYVSLAGSDAADGSASHPLLTIERARDVLRQRRDHAAATVYLREGRYVLGRTLEFSGEDVNTTYAAYPREQVILDAGVALPPMRPAMVNGLSGLAAVVPADWDVRELFVNERRAPRPRLPRLEGDGSQSVFRFQSAPNVGVDGNGKTIADTFKGADSFTARLGDVKAFHNLTDVEAVVLHFWIEERMPLESFDPVTRKVVSTRQSIMSLADDHTGLWGRYFLENVEEGMVPGDFYFDRPIHTVYYVPLPGERGKSVRAFAPMRDEILSVEGSRGLIFRGLTFTHAGWHHPAEFPGPYHVKVAKNLVKPPAGMSQTANTLPAALQFAHAHDCAIEQCTLSHLGEYALSLGEGCHHILVGHNTITDLGGGGIKIGGGDIKAPVESQNHDNVITDNIITHIGRVFPSAAAVFLQHAHHITIAHNEIADGYEMAVADGWSWGYKPSVTHDNLIEYNHIHDFGHRWLSDMGAIYTLGLQPGTVIRNNHIHDIYAATYGGWGIYPDEGSSNILIENNLVHDTSQQAFHQHYGENNVVRNNIFAFGQQGVFEITRKEDHNSLTLTHNLLIADKTPIYAANIDAGRNFVADQNFFWDISGHVVRLTASKDLEGWRSGGHDEHSIIADPHFVDVGGRNFLLPEKSPAFGIGFQPIDLSQVGPRPVAR